VLLFLGASSALWAQSAPPPDEIPLEHCDKLPVVKVRIEKIEYRFLVDTGATTFLHLKSFSGGKSGNIKISSWSGTGSTSAREVSLPELVLGLRRLTNLKLPAVDLSAIGEACGGKIDGILGVDLLEKFGATIDLQRRVARLGGLETVPRVSEEAEREHHAQMEEQCLGAFNRADLKALEECLDPEVVLFTPWGEFRGRTAMLNYVRDRYFAMKPLPRMEIRTKSTRILGNAAWYDYDYSIISPAGRIDGRGTGLCRRHGDRWYLLNMHNSRVEPDPGK